MTAPVQWAVLGTANIAARAFLPALRAAGGTAAVVGSRDPDRARDWAAENEVDGVADYGGALADPRVGAVYIALPNDHHVEWAARAVAAGHAVVCEKPLGLDAAQVRTLLDQVPSDALLWESFVFPFHPQTDLIMDQLPGLGHVHEVVSEFHFTAADPGNIRWQAALGGGALMDVGCYPIRLARLLFGSEPVAAAARSFAGPGVDAETAGVLDFPDDQRLVFSCGMRRPMSTTTRIVGDDGELRISNPFHPRPSDSMRLRVGGRRHAQWPAASGTAFEHAIRHVHAVLAGTQTPRHLARTDALGNAQAIDLVRAALTTGGA